MTYENLEEIAVEITDIVDSQFIKIKSGMLLANGTILPVNRGDRAEDFIYQISHFSKTFPRV